MISIHHILNIDFVLYMFFNNNCKLLVDIAAINLHRGDIRLFLAQYWLLVLSNELNFIFIFQKTADPFGNIALC